jgi:peroxiredoxin
MATSSHMLEIGTPAPDFDLPEVTGGGSVARSDLTDAPVLLVAFLCRHCPYVVHVQEAFASLAREYASQGVAVVGIASNDPAVSPDDSPERLAEQKHEVGFDFPYLHDAAQEVAKAYRAACTPDLYVFDGDLQLVYRGRMDDSRPGSGREPTGADLRAALDAALRGDPPLAEQHPSIGCSIKWRPGNEPD